LPLQLKDSLLRKSLPLRQAKGFSLKIGRQREGKERSRRRNEDRDKKDRIDYIRFGFLAA
jgi:hypothetical protein